MSITQARLAFLRALRDEQVEICFRVETNEALAAYWGVEHDHPLGVVSRAIDRGYVDRVRDVTYGENAFMVAWICGLTDAGRTALARLEERHGRE